METTEIPTKKKLKINWRYALGELAIVSFGILIAFGVNRWADAQRNKAKIRQYYSNLIIDLEEDVAKLDTIKLQIGKNIQTNFKVLRYCGQDLPGKDTIPLLFFQNLKTRFDFYPADATFQSLKYSGDFQLINNIELKNQIVNHYNKYDLIEETNEQ